MARYNHDPDSEASYGWDWRKWILAENILTSTWTITPSGPTITLSTHDTWSTTVWVTGGTLGVNYTLTNHITTDAPDSWDRSHTLHCTNL